MSEDSNREAAERYFRAFERWDLAAVELLVADAAAEGRPQSGERFVGRANIMGMLGALPSEPTISWRVIRGGGRVWIAEGTVEYGEWPVNLIGVAEFEGGKMTRPTSISRTRSSRPIGALPSSSGRTRSRAPQTRRNRRAEPLYTRLCGS